MYIPDITVKVQVPNMWSWVKSFKYFDPMEEPLNTTDLDPRL